MYSIFSNAVQLNQTFLNNTTASAIPSPASAVGISDGKVCVRIAHSSDICFEIHTFVMLTSLVFLVSFALFFFICGHCIARSSRSHAQLSEQGCRHHRYHVTSV